MFVIILLFLTIAYSASLQAGESTAKLYNTLILFSYRLLAVVHIIQLLNFINRSRITA